MFTLYCIVFQGDTEGCHVQYEQQRHRTSKARDGRGPRSRVSPPHGACTPLAKSKEKERLLAIYHTHSSWLKIFFRVCGSYLITLHLSAAQKLSDMCRSPFAPLQKSRPNHCCYEKKPYPVWFQCWRKCYSKKGVHSLIVFIVSYDSSQPVPGSEIVVKVKSRSKIRKRTGAGERRDKNGRKRVVKKMLTGSLSLPFFPPPPPPLPRRARLFSLCSFNTSPLYHLRAWHRLESSLPQIPG